MRDTARKEFDGATAFRDTCMLWISGVILLGLFLAQTATLTAQTLSVWDIDVSAYPRIRAKYFALDANGNPLPDLLPADVHVRENGSERAVTQLSCPPLVTPKELSSVLTIDISPSMFTEYKQNAKAAARAWINALPLGRSECAITSFGNLAFINRDFTTVRGELLDAVAAIGSDGGTNYDAALLTPPTGALAVSMQGIHDRVIVLISDGQPNFPPASDSIIAEAGRQQATIHGVILGNEEHGLMREICAATGGQLFEDVSSEAEAEEACLRILKSSQGFTPCEIEWISQSCDNDPLLEIVIPKYGLSTRKRLRIETELLPQLIFSPANSLHFGRVLPGTQTLNRVTITARNGTITVEKFNLNHPWFSIADYGGPPPPFTLNHGQSRQLTLRYGPADSTYAFCSIDTESDACVSTAFYTDGGWTYRRAPIVSLHVASPNGGERLFGGSVETLRWRGVMPNESVQLEYSPDNGRQWSRISDDASGLKHDWLVPGIASDSCLLRASVKAQAIFEEEMVLIPAGSFRMGDIVGTGDKKQMFEVPVHTVTITRPFLMSRTEVTQKLYESVMGRNPSYWDGLTAPVERVSWDEAVEFCNELSRMEGLTPCFSGKGANTTCDFTANGYRLPTEAEWEYACRGGTETDFYTGNMTHGGTSPLDDNLNRAGWYGGNSGGRSHPVGEKAPNAFGLHDMHGNVYEWCWDWIDPRYYTVSPATDPRGPATGTNRVFRGGSHSSHCGAYPCRSSYRYFYNVNGNADIGIRIVRTN